MMINIQNLFRKNLPVKILALLAAIVMWGYVMNEENPSVNTSYTVPVELINVPEGYDVSMDSTDVTLKVRAQRALIASVSEGDFKAVVDLADSTEGEYDMKIKPLIPQGFELLGISDDDVKVTLESLIYHGVPVDISIMGKPAEGLELASVAPRQPYVNVYGPRHLVETVARTVGKIRLSDNKADFTMRVSLAAVDSEGRTINNLAVIPSEMDVTVQLVTGTGTKSVQVKPVVNGILPEGYKLGDISVTPEQVEVTGSNKLLADLTSLDTKPISLANLKDDVTQEVEVALPEGLTAKNAKVSVKIQIVSSNGEADNDDELAIDSE